MPPRTDEPAHLHEFKKGFNCNLSLYYRVWRIYLRQLKDDPGKQEELMESIFRAMEEDYQKSLKKESPS